MPTEEFPIPNDAGHRLSGSLEIPIGLVRGAALFAHCFTCSKQSRAAMAVSRALAREGIATLRFDFTGIGDSEGEFGDAGFAADIADLVAAAKAMRGRFAGPLLLVGHSLGGAAVLAAADDLGRENIAAIATIGAPSDVAHVLHNLAGDIDAIRHSGAGEVRIAGRAFRIGSSFLEHLEEADLLGEVERIRCPLLFLHSPTDDVVGVEHAARLFSAAHHPKSFVSLDDADHLLLDEENANFVAGVIASWARRYLPLREDWPLPARGVVVKSGHGKFGTEVHTPTHRFLADEPRSYGGDDSGPTPYELLAASLGTCTAMTIRAYAARKDWPLEDVTVEVTHERDHAHAGDHVEAMAQERSLQALHRTIALTGEGLDDMQRARLLEIADRCPVHRTLEGELHIHTVLRR